MKKIRLTMLLIIFIVLLVGCRDKEGELYSPKNNNQPKGNAKFVNSIIINDPCLSYDDDEVIETLSSGVEFVNKKEIINYLKFESGLTYFRNLMLNMRGIDVKGVNKALSLLGYGTNAKSILFDNRTKNAIMSFQRSNKLTVDGIVGKKTISTLNLALKNKDISISNIDVTPKNIPSKSYWITINKTTNVLTLYNGYNVAKRYSVASGRLPSLTPEGKFVIANKVVNPSWGGNGKSEPIPGGSPNNPLGTRWIGINWGDGTKYGIHGNSNPSSIGHFVSSGCIRMYNVNVEELFTIVSRNTPVWIGTYDKLNNWMMN